MPDTPETIEQSAGNGLELTILMPCLNEAETLEVCILKAQRFLDHCDVPGEVLVADNGSTDGSQAIAARLGARVVEVPEKGYGAALLGGIAASKGRYIVMGDADDSYDFSNLMPFVEKLREGFDVVMGNRFLGGIEPGAMPPLHRFLGNPVLSGLGRLFFRSPSGDFHCGLRGFSREAAEKMDLRTTGMEFASEMIVKATLYRMKIAEVPTTLKPDGRSRPPHLRSWRDGWRHLRFMLMYSPRWLFLIPGIGLMLLGGVAGVAVVLGPVKVGGVVLDVNTLVYSATAVTLGFQAVIFAVFTKVFAINSGLLPPDRRLDKLFEHVTLEVGLIAGCGLLLLGLAGAVTSLLLWNRASFGPLDPARSLRFVVPAALGILLGVQVILASFFLSVLGLRKR